MNTSGLKSFAQQARILLREGVERRIHYWGFEKNGENTATLEDVTGGYIFRGSVGDDASTPSKWQKLKAAIENSSLDEVVERAAYTWFNRLMAIKILSKNGYETSQLDYLSDETHTPAILERARRGLVGFLTSNERKRLQPLLADYERDLDAFVILLIGYCHQHPLLQGIFGAIDDYTELLLPDDILAENGFLHILNTTDTISDNDYKQVELIGWLYQFYISEKKDEVFAGFKQNKKAEAKDIPAATQIFTPNWIVKYLVQNTLGRTWLDVHPSSDIKKDWKYLVAPSTGNQHSATTATQPLTVESLTFLDPAVGSGHILVEALDTLYPMYMEEYYSPDEAIQCILKQNLFGLDIDLRAVQLAQFAVVLKAAQYSRTVLQGETLPHIYATPPRRVFNKEEVAIFLGDKNGELVAPLCKALKVMEEAHNLGCIMVFELTDEARKVVEDRYHFWEAKIAVNFDEQIIQQIFPAYIPILLILTSKFSCIAANPPYMGQKNMNAGLKKYVNKHYALTKSDLFSVFMDVCIHLLHNNGRYGMINMHSWMFLGGYEQFRNELLSSQVVESMLHLGPRTFDELNGEVVQNTAFVIRKEAPDKSEATYYRLVNGKSSNEKKDLFLERSGEFTSIPQENFSKITGSPIAYWVSNDLLNAFSEGTIFAYVEPKNGMSIHTEFVCNWEEVDFREIGLNIASKEENISSGKKWFPLSRGGEFRKWYGNFDYVANYKNDGEDLKYFVTHNPSDPETTHWSRRLTNTDYHYKPAITWNKISSSGTSFRMVPQGYIYSDAGPFIPLEDHYLIGYLNSRVAEYILKVLNPTLNFYANNIGTLPFRMVNDQKPLVEEKVAECILISEADWRSREASWDFQGNPLIATEKGDLQSSFHEWQQQVSKLFFQLHGNEEELNRIFIDIYGLQQELTSDVLLEDITILQEEVNYNALEQIERPYVGKLVPIRADVVMQQFISYIVGCYMGRYRLDKGGLHIAHPNPTEEELAPYFLKNTAGTDVEFQIDDDAIIPIMGSNGSFTDDLMHRVKEFLSLVWGDETLTGNINFLQQQLGKNLEEYLVKDFWKYHVKTYGKKPIYWSFTSKNGAFQVLVYMHRMNGFTLAKIRSKYLIPHISWLQNLMADMEKNSFGSSKMELKRIDLIRGQLDDCLEYDLLLKDMADRQISFDLDNGVRNNYALFNRVVAVMK